MATRLYVGNLSYQTTDQELQDLFAEIGNVTSVQVMIDRQTGQSRGFGFVEMATEDEAQQAIASMNGRNLGGRSLRVNESRPREERGGGNFGYSRGPRDSYGGGDNFGGGGGYGGRDNYGSGSSGGGRDNYGSGGGNRRESAGNRRGGRDSYDNDRW
jgi:RNA recognition motif-containing protein